MEACQHHRRATRLREIHGGGFQIKEQCLSCGCPVGNAKPHAEYQRAELDGWDVELQEADERRRALAYQAHKDEKEEADGEWRESYEAYLRSPEWDRRRRKVLSRNPICEGCLANQSTQVHHETYRNLGREFAFQLRALCDQCHERYHKWTGAALEEWFGKWMDGPKRRK